MEQNFQLSNTTVYTLNERGVNRIYATVYPGFDNDGKRVSNEEVEAVARLFAASPDMLAALQAVVRVADRNTVEFDAARAAIAKATGEEEQHGTRIR